MGRRFSVGQTGSESDQCCRSIYGLRPSAPRQSNMKLERILSLTDRHSQQVTRALIIFILIASSALALISGDSLRYPDERDYSNLAQSMLEGKGYANEEGDPTAYRPPGWPFVLTAVFSIYDHPLAAKLLNAIALAGTAWLLSSLVARNAAHGQIFVPLILLIYPLVWYTATTLYPQIFGAALLAAILVLLNQDVRSVARCSIAGLLLGFLILNIPAFLLLTPLILTGLYLSNKESTALDCQALSAYPLLRCCSCSAMDHAKCLHPSCFCSCIYKFRDQPPAGQFGKHGPQQRS